MPLEWDLITDWQEMQPFGSLDVIYEIADYTLSSPYFTRSARRRDRNILRMTGEVGTKRLPNAMS